MLTEETATLLKAAWGFICRHPLSIALTAVVAALTLRLSLAHADIDHLTADLKSARAEVAQDQGKLTDLATQSSAREATAKAAAATAMKLAQAYQVRSTTIQATPLPAGANPCAAASALITKTLTEDALR